MTRQTRQDLLLIIDALCEGTGTATQRAQLEELVLGESAARKLYVEVMELHGLLHWDAGGIGAAQVPVAPRQKSSRIRWSIAASALAVAAVLAIGLVGWLWRSPGPGLIVEEGTIPAPASVPLLADTPPRPSEIPNIRLPAPEPLISPAAPEQPPLVAESKPNQPIVPALHSDAEVIAFINEELQRSWQEHGVVPSAPAADSEWVRRVYLDLAGRIPTIAEIERFLADDPADRRLQLVDSLLDGREYSRRLATVWINLLVGRVRSEMIDRSALLSWLEDGFANNRSWRDTVTDLITARGAASQSGPANFLLAHLNNQAVPATAITARILLCEQLQCIQCHQHPLAKDWGQERFWQFNAFFQQTGIREAAAPDQTSGGQQRVRELVDTQQFGPTFYETLRGVMLVAYPKFAGVELSSDTQLPLRDQLAKLLFAEARPQPARAFINRTWSQLFGRGFTTPVDDMGPHTPVSHPELLEGLTAAFVDSDYDVKRLIRWICLSDAYQLSSRETSQRDADSMEPGELPLFTQIELRPLSAEQLFDSLLIASGLSPRKLSDPARQLEREDWLKQLFTAVETEENGESNTLDGSLTQVLLLMNGDLVERATSLKPGSLLHQIASKPGATETEKIRLLSLAALSRQPDSKELSRIRTMLRFQVRQRVERQVPPPQAALEGFRDVYWAFLNSSEFAVNR